MRRITIRPVAATDEEDLISANRSSVALHRPWVHPFADKIGFQAYHESLDGVQTVGLVARESVSNQVVGVLTISQIVRGKFQSAYLGFYGMEGQVRKGHMTEAVRATVAHAFHELGLHRLEANIQPENLRSIALVERVGFRKEGYSRRYLYIDDDWRDHERWAILADDNAV